jgi:hypothetical protein
VRHVVSTAILGVALAACGAGSSGKRTATTQPTPTTSAADAKAADLAAKAIIRRGDVGAGWVLRAAGRGSSPPRADDCAQRPDGPLTNLGPGASQLGASLRPEGDKRVVLSSSSLVFRDDVDVETYLAIRSSSQWHDCRRTQLELNQRKARPRRTVVTTRQTTPAVGTGNLVAYSVFTVMSHPAKGKPAVAVATATESAYRFGRVILSIKIDVASKTDVGPEFRSTTAAALRRIAARVGAG